MCFEFVDVDAYWNYWIDGSGKQYRLRFNRSDRAYGASEITQFCLHELIGHCGQASGWHSSAIKLSKSTRLLTVHSCEQVHLEGFGQGLPFLLAAVAPNNDLVELRTLTTLLRQLLLNNAYLSLAHGERIENVIQVFERYLPVFDLDRLIKNLADQAQDPVMRTYMFSYPKGVELIYEISKKPDQVASFVRESIARPMLAHEIQALAD